MGIRGDEKEKITKTKGIIQILFQKRILISTFSRCSTIFRIHFCSFLYSLAFFNFTLFQTELTLEKSVSEELIYNFKQGWNSLFTLTFLYKSEIQTISGFLEMTRDVRSQAIDLRRIETRELTENKVNSPSKCWTLIFLCCWIGEGSLVENFVNIPPHQVNLNLAEMELLSVMTMNSHVLSFMWDLSEKYNLSISFFSFRSKTKAEA